MDTLKEQRELTDERAEHDAIRDALNTGFLEKLAEVQDRHSVRVSIMPVALTDVTHGRGGL